MSRPARASVAQSPSSDAEPERADDASAAECGRVVHIRPADARAARAARGLDDLDEEDEDDDLDEEDEDDDLDEEDEEDETEDLSGPPAAEAPPAAPGRKPRAAASGAPAGGLDPLRPPRGAAWFKVARADARGRLETCGVHDEARGMTVERFPAAPPGTEGLSAAGILELWGSGRYTVSWHKEDGGYAGKVTVTVGRDGVPTKPPVARVAPPPAPTAERPRRAAPPAPPPVPSPKLPPLGALGGGSLESFFALQSYFEQRNEAALLRLERESELRVQRLRADHELSLNEQAHRHERALKDEEERHRRNVQHMASLTENLLRARDLGPLQDRLDDLEEQIQENSPNKLMETLGPILAGVGEVFKKPGPVANDPRIKVEPKE